MKTRNSKQFEDGVPSGARQAGCGAERRGQPRVYPSTLSAVLNSGDQRWVVMIGDISLSGARILNAPPDLAVGDSLCLATLLCGTDTMTVPCTIVRVEANEAHAQIGVRFEASKVAQNEALDRYLRAHIDGAEPAERANAR
ncbi:MAG TPA: PilZ domain-containing protein [Chthonomonadaceae bacterium]|nr:PilZ domain-containing protein [Chthonomonadaceae bacterium]